MQDDKEPKPYEFQELRKDLFEAGEQLSRASKSLEPLINRKIASEMRELKSDALRQISISVINGDTSAMLEWSMIANSFDDF